jgi:PKD repeat protein
MKKKINLTKAGLPVLLIITAVIACIISCKRETVSGGLGALPKADFTVMNTDANNVVLINHSSTSSIPYWTVVESGAKYTGDSAKVYFGFASTYHVQLTVVGKGGIDSVTKPITIQTNDPDLCAPGTMQGFVSGCTQKQWRLLQDAAALGVGPNEGDVSWWSNALSDVTAGRPCTFNDVFIFKLGLGNNFWYNDLGDYYTEDYEGPSNWSCADESTLSGAQKAWGTDTTDFSYQIVANAGTHPNLGQLKLNGTGAHLALPKVQNGGQVSSGPVSNALIYNIIDTAHDASGNSILTVSIESPAGTWWRMKLSTN